MQKRETHPEKQHVVGIVLLIFVFIFVVLADDTFELLDYLNDGGDVWTFIGVFFGIGTAVLIIGQYVLPEYRIYLFPLSFLLLFFSIYFLFFELFSIFIELDYSNYMVGLIAIIFLIISIIFLLEFLIRTFKTILIKFPRTERMIIVYSVVLVAMILVAIFLWDDYKTSTLGKLFIGYIILWPLFCLLRSVKRSLD